MKDYLNTAENIKAGFLSVDKRIRQIEEAIGEDRIESFSQRVADFLFHMQTESPSLNSIIETREKQSTIAISILNASCEIETAFHILTIGNIPAIYRQCRLCHEYTSSIIFMSLPRKFIVTDLSEKHNLVKKFKENPSLNFWDLYKSSFKKMGDNVQRIDPIIKGNSLLPPYLEFLREHLPHEESEMTWLSTQVKHVLHPTSHGSIEMLPYHFGTLDKDGKGGLNYSSNKIEMYKEGMDYILWNIEFLVRTLDMTRQFIIDYHET